MNEIERKELMIHREMLNAQIDCIMNTDNYEVLQNMFIASVLKLITIYDKNKSRLADK